VDAAKIAAGRGTGSRAAAGRGGGSPARCLRAWGAPGAGNCRQHWPTRTGRPTRPAATNPGTSCAYPRPGEPPSSTRDRATEPRSPSRARRCAPRRLLRNRRPLSSDLARQVLGTYRKDGAERGRSIITSMTAMQSGTPHMPMVVGLDLPTAREVISSVLADPQVSIEHRDTDVVPPGRVFVQQPPAGVHVSPRSQIQLTVSTRPTAGCGTPE